MYVKLKKNSPLSSPIPFPLKVTAVNMCESPLGDFILISVNISFYNI